MHERYISFLGKGNLALAHQAQEQQACWGLFSFPPPFKREIVSHGPNNLQHNSTDGWINKQPSRRPCGAGWAGSQGSFPERMQPVELCHPTSLDAKCIHWVNEAAGLLLFRKWHRKKIPTVGDRQRSCHW